MSIDLDAPLRRRKPEKRNVRLRTRATDKLQGIVDVPISVAKVVVDTNVYIDAASGVLSPEVKALLGRVHLFHCSVCLAEIATGLGHADPADPRWSASRDYYSALMRGMPPARILIPDETIWLDAGILAGTLARTQGLQRHQRKEALNDALILLTAAKHGLPVLTSDRADFDLLQQLAPETAFYWY